MIGIFIFTSADRFFLSDTVSLAKNASVDDPSPINVTISGFTLLVNNQSFFVRGVGEGGSPQTHFLDSA